jgi:hypothetical protein
VLFFLGNFIRKKYVPVGVLWRNEKITWGRRFGQGSWRWWNLGLAMSLCGFGTNSSLAVSQPRELYVCIILSAE